MLPEPFPEPQIERLSLQKMWGHILSILNLERGMFYTIWQLILAPGSAMRCYLFTDRSNFMEPLKFLVISIAFFLFMAINFFPNSNWFGVDQESISNGNEVTYSIAAYLKQYANVVMLFTVPIAAWVSWRIFRKYRLNYGEHLVLNAFLYGFLTLISILILPISLKSANSYSNALLILFLLYSTYFFRSLFVLPWLKAIWYSLLYHILNFIGAAIVMTLVVLVAARVMA